MKKTGRISSEKKYLNRLRVLVLDSLKGQKVQVVLFGSRAKGTHYPTSDVDIGVIPRSRTAETRLTYLREEVENSNIPYKVDILNLKETSLCFRKEAMKDAVVWKD